HAPFGASASRADGLGPLPHHSSGLRRLRPRPAWPGADRTSAPPPTPHHRRRRPPDRPIPDSVAPNWHEFGTLATMAAFPVRSTVMSHAGQSISLTRFLLEAQRDHDRINADLRLLIEVVARACKSIS